MSWFPVGQRPDRQPAELRRRMVEKQIERRGVRDPRVLAAIRAVPREAFVPVHLADRAYADTALPIDCQQTISQPYIVAAMTEALQLSGRERVLEIGTGSGYQTAVLCRLAREVITIERHPRLSGQAQARLRELGLGNVTFLTGDGWEGWPQLAPYERILVTAAAPGCPPALWEQLAEGGVLVGPFGGEETQMLQRIAKREGQPQVEDLTACRFVPLVPGAAE